MVDSCLSQKVALIRLMVSEKTSFSDAKRRRTTDARAATASLLTQSGRNKNGLEICWIATFTHKFVDNLLGVSEKTNLTDGWTPVTRHYLCWHSQAELTIYAKHLLLKCTTCNTVCHISQALVISVILFFLICYCVTFFSCVPIPVAHTCNILHVTISK